MVPVAAMLSSHRHYSPEVLPEALASARNIQDNYSRAKTLSELIAFLPEVKLEALEAARNI